MASLYDEYQDLNWNVKEKQEIFDNEKAYKEQKKKELIKKAKREQQIDIDEIKSQADPKADKKKKFTTTKLLMYIILFNCIAIEIYSMWVMYALRDLSALYSLIGAVIGESLSYAIYCAKSFNETKEEVKAALERDKFKSGLYEEDDEEESDEDEDVTDDTDSN